MIRAILLYFVAAALSAFAQSGNTIGSSITLLVAVLVVFMMSIIGIFRIWSGLQTPIAGRVVMLLLLLIPLIGLLTLVFINSRATRFLREQGYRVGFLGASPA